MSLREQFARPTGLLGWLAGHLMARGNRELNRWVVSRLGIAPTDRVLEIGFGPGVGIREAARLATAGHVAGIDPSPPMLRQASRRNARAIRRGRVELRVGCAEVLAFEDRSFDKAFSVDSTPFWIDPEAAARELRRVLRPGGLVALAVQPRGNDATEATSRMWQERLVRLLTTAGFSGVTSEVNRLPPAPAVCASARR